MKEYNVKVVIPEMSYTIEAEDVETAKMIADDMVMQNIEQNGYSYIVEESSKGNE